MRRTFGPVVLVGLAAGALAAVAGARDWVVGSTDRLESTDEAIIGVSVGQMPLAGALALVVLACWGVLLVTRGRVRQVVAVLGAAASLGIVATCAVAWWSLPDQVTETMERAVGGGPVETGWTGWYPAAWVAAVLCLLSTAAAVRLAPTWPEMGRRYDAPGTQAGAAAGGAVAQSGTGAGPDAGEESSQLEMWKALDEGHDPTDPGPGDRFA